jgi:glycosyltransferase involved in cell wall biosynthesis
MVKCKRVDLLLHAVGNICCEPIFGRLDVVGVGPERGRLLKLARKLNLSDKCVFHEPVTPERVRQLMREADIYVLPSNRYEGWGVVANEAMSEGAVLVANEQAGAASVLVEHGKTGFLFRDGDVAGLTTILRTLLTDAALREGVRQAAWRELHSLWHPRVGAERLVALSRGLLGEAPMTEYLDGPCRHLAELSHGREV